MQDSGNIADRLSAAAARHPEQPAIIRPAPFGRPGLPAETCSFRELDEDSSRIASGLVDLGVQPGMRLVLFVPFSRDFIALTFGVLRSGATLVLIDPGMGRQNIFECLHEVDPDGFIAIPIVHAVRLLKRRLFPRARLNVTVGRRWLWGGTTLSQLRRASVRELPKVTASDRAAVIFTSGSTGAPKGVVYEHGMFASQVEQIQSHYGIESGEVDLPGFPLFGLFNAAMGVTTVIPEMDPTRPADVDPRKIVHAIREHTVTQAFGSPAFWNRVGRYCEVERIELPTIRRGLSAGGPVPVHVLRRMKTALTAPGADLFTPYGATESLPVASIGAGDVLADTAQRTATGAGTCVGTPFPDVEVRIIRPHDGPIAEISEAIEEPAGTIGEIIVRGPAVTREYFERPDATALAKIQDPAGPSQGRPGFWHRIGDMGYLDLDGRLWFCGRKAHVVHSANGPMYSVCCEAIFNEHPRIYRSALIGVGPRGSQVPAIVAEPEESAFPASKTDEERLAAELRELGAANPLTESIEVILFHRSLPVDTRHNVKINREQLAEWAAQQPGWASVR